MYPGRTSRRKRAWHTAAALCLAAAPAGVVACGEEDKKSGSKAKKLQIEATGSGKNITLKVPKSVEGGVVEITFKNSAGDAQEAGLIKVEGGRTEKDFLRVLGSEGGPIPGWISAGGGVGETKPGQARTVTQRLSPGRWYVYDTNVENGPPATAPLTVEAGDGGELPETNATVTASEYKFEATGLQPGANEITFENKGKELHHVVALPVKKGATIEDVKKAFQEEGEPSGPPPFDEANASSTAVIGGGESQVTDLQLKKGRYAFACFIQDRKGGPPHVAKGMVTETTVD